MSSQFFVLNHFSGDVYVVTTVTSLLNSDFQQLLSWQWVHFPSETWAVNHANNDIPWPNENEHTYANFGTIPGHVWTHLP